MFWTVNSVKLKTNIPSILCSLIHQHRFPSFQPETFAHISKKSRNFPMPTYHIILILMHLECGIEKKTFRLAPCEIDFFAITDFPKNQTKSGQAFTSQWQHKHLKNIERILY